MNDFLPLDDADRLIASLTGEPLSIGKARRLAKKGKLKVCFAHYGFIGLFPIAKHPPTAYTKTTKRILFDGYLQSIARPRLDVKTIKNDEQGETTFLCDYLRPVAVAVPEDATNPQFNQPGLFLGRIRVRTNEHTSVVEGHCLDLSHVSLDHWRIQSSEIKSIFQSQHSVSSNRDPKIGLNWTLRKPKFSKYNEAVYEYLQTAFGKNKLERPTALDLVAEWRRKPTHPIIGVEDGLVTYENARGTAVTISGTQENTLKAIAAVIKRMATRTAR